MQRSIQAGKESSVCAVVNPLSEILCQKMTFKLVSHSAPKDDFQTGLSFRRRETWISEIDICISSEKTLKFIKSLSTNQDLQLPSDHAPLELEVECPSGFTLGSLDDLMTRSADLSRTVELYQEKRLVTRGPLYSTVDKQQFTTQLSSVNLPPIESDLDHHVEWINDTMNNIARKSRIPRTPAADAWDVNQDRWTRLLSSCDPRTIWRAIGWKGVLKDGDDAVVPPDHEFRLHEHLLNLDESLLRKE